MTEALWLLVVALTVGAVSSVFPAQIGAIAILFSIVLAMGLLVIANRRKLCSRLKPGEKIPMPAYQKIILAIFAVIAIGLVFIGSLTIQK